MSPSSRHLSPVSAAANRRQLANVALATVLAFVIAGMVVVLVAFPGGLASIVKRRARATET